MLELRRLEARGSVLGYCLKVLECRLLRPRQRFAEGNRSVTKLPGIKVRIVHRFARLNLWNPRWAEFFLDQSHPIHLSEKRMVTNVGNTIVGQITQAFGRVPYQKTANQVDRSGAQHLQRRGKGVFTPNDPFEHVDFGFFSRNIEGTGTCQHFVQNHSKTPVIFW